MNPTSRLWIAPNQLSTKKIMMAPKFADTASSWYFWGYSFFLSSNIVTVNIITDSGVWREFDLTGSDFPRNLEIIKTSVWVFPNISRVKQVRDTKFDMNLSNETLSNSAKCQLYSLYRFWVIKVKPTGG